MDKLVIAMIIIIIIPAPMTYPSRPNLHMCDLDDPVLRFFLNLVKPVTLKFNTLMNLDAL